MSPYDLDQELHAVEESRFHIGVSIGGRPVRKALGSARLPGVGGGVKDMEDEGKPTLWSMMPMISFKDLAVLRIVLAWCMRTIRASAFFFDPRQPSTTWLAQRVEIPVKFLYL